MSEVPGAPDRFGSGTGPIRASSPVITGMTAPDFTAPTNKGHTLAPDAFADRLSVILVFPGRIDTMPGIRSVGAFDALLPEFGARRVQLLAVASATPRALREQAGDLALTILADEDDSIRTAFGIDATSPAAVMVDRHGIVTAILTGDDALTPFPVIEMVDDLLAVHPDSVEAHPNVPVANERTHPEDAHHPGYPDAREPTRRQG